MSFILRPWQLYFLILAGWIHRQQQEVIEYLRTENQVLKEQIGKKRILLSDDQRRRLAVVWGTLEIIAVRGRPSRVYGWLRGYRLRVGLRMS